jgi:hypothetical protein
MEFSSIRHEGENSMLELSGNVPGAVISGMIEII